MSMAIGVIGGLGPAATLDFHSRLLRHGGAATDQEHLRIIIDSDPSVPDRNAAIAGRGESPGPHLARMAAGLERAGAGVIVMACNAAHAWQKEIEAVISVPFLSMIDAAAAEALALEPRRVGLLAADATIGAGLYQKAFGRHGVETVHPDQNRFMELLYRIKSGDTGEGVSAAMLELADSMRGIDVLLAACTEVPLVLGGYGLPCVDAGDALARAAVRTANRSR